MMEKTDRNDRDNRDRGDRSDRGGDDSKFGAGFKKNRPSKDLRFDYKDIDVLQRFVAEDGKMTPSRVNRLNAKQQRELTTAIKRARQLALLPIAANHTMK